MVCKRLLQKKLKKKLYLLNMLSKNLFAHNYIPRTATGPRFSRESPAAPCRKDATRSAQGWTWPAPRPRFLQTAARPCARIGPDAGDDRGFGSSRGVR